jgi:methylated-DNA-[protein]-cysteine S-methyltransferase
MINKPRASRAVGSALARNPIPLIIPCHRVIHSDGSLGNFSAIGGTSTKKKLLALETKVHKLL